MFQAKVVDKTRTHVLCLITFFSSENRAVYEDVGHGRAGEAADDNREHALFLLDN